MKKILLVVTCLIYFQASAIEKKRIDVMGEAKSASHEECPGSGIFVDTYTCSPDNSKVCYSITIYVSGINRAATFIEEGEISYGQLIGITGPDGTIKDVYFHGYSYTPDPASPYLDRIHKIQYSLN